MNPAKRHEIFSRLRAANPHPATELEYSTPFELLVAVVLSAQATDKGVNLATRKLFPIANTPEKIVALGEAGLVEFIKTIGLYKSKAKHIAAACRMLIEQHGSEVPADRALLMALPGVGRKTANVILNTAFGQPTMAVDTHIFRVANRIGLAPGKTVLEVEEKLLRVVPKEFRVDAHHWLILHGRYVCQARKPKCGECIIADLCEYQGKTILSPQLGGSKRNAQTAPTPTLPPNGGGSKRNAQTAPTPTLPPNGGGSKRNAQTG
jgi:endonuclease-3